jgi:hypothetical protein
MEYSNEKLNASNSKSACFSSAQASQSEETQVVRGNLEPKLKFVLRKSLSKS